MIRSDVALVGERDHPRLRCASGARPNLRLMDERSTSVPVPLDSEGFLRRECPTCEREFKWLPSDDSEPVEPGGYYCPYCGIQAPVEHWLTKPQAEFAREVA